MKKTRSWIVALSGTAGTAAALGALWTVASQPMVRAQNAAQSPVAPELVGGTWLNTAQDDKGNNKPLRLADRRGKVTIVEFWTYGCSNCQANLPAYARWQKQFEKRDVQIIGIHTPETQSERDPKNVARFVRDNNITYPVLIDGKSENWRRWGQQYWPTVYLVDKAGRVRANWEGELNWKGAGGEAKMGRFVEALLKEPAPQGTAQGSARTSAQTQPKSGGAKVTKVIKSDEEWKKILTAEQFAVLRKHGTERPGSSELKSHDKGIYKCAACGLELYSSDTKFDSGTGWPSFYQPIAGHVAEKTDADGSRTEVLCARCEGHLGHVFDDGPRPTGLRYCMNGVALKFDKQP